MPVVIVDTDVVSYIFKGDTRGDLYEPHLTNAIASISFMTLAELEQWSVVRQWGARRHSDLLQFIKNRFVVVDSNAVLCRQWAEVRGGVKANGGVIETADAWIAATALLYASPLITHNAADFALVPGLSVISEN